jgi:hypothetical protein
MRLSDARRRCRQTKPVNPHRPPPCCVTEATRRAIAPTVCSTSHAHRHSDQEEPGSSADIRITALSNFGKCCWNGRFRSTVTNTSNSAAEGQQLAVRYSQPTLICDGTDINSGEPGRQANIDAFVEKDSQAASVTARVVARSRNAITCGRDTEGNPARNSSMESPASRYSISV